MIGTVSYGLCAAAFALLALLVALSRRTPDASRRERVWLLVACLATTTWAGVVVLNLYRLLPMPAVQVAESLRDGLWLYFLSGLLPRVGSDNRTQWLRRFALALPTLWLMYAVWAWAAPTWTELSVEDLGLSMVLGGLVTALVGLALVEQISRNLTREKRWAVKYLCLGLGAVFVYDLYLYSYALLLHTIDVNLWDARGAVNALAVPLIAVSVARNPQWSADLFVSRRVAFHTATLMGGGFYLLAMAGGGYFVREVGGTWGRFAEILFFAGAIVVLLVALFSGQLRARLRVFLNKHFFSYKYDYREEWLRLVGQLYSEKQFSDPYERAIAAVADIVESSGGAVWMYRDAKGFEPAANHNFRVQEPALIDPDESLPSFLQHCHWIVDLREFVERPQAYADLTLPTWLAKSRQAWLVVPLLQEESLIGFLVLAHSRAPRSLTWEDRDLLKAVGRQVGGFLAHYRDARALSEARQFQAYNRITTFLMHDLKNVMAQQSLLVRNAARYKSNPAFVDDMVSTVEHSVERMRRLLEQLRRGGGRDMAERVDVAELVQRAVARCSDREPTASVAIESQGSRIRVEPDTLMMVVSHIVSNAQDATPADGEVLVRVASRGPQVLIEVEDNGCGMDATFVRTRLFEPFYTTKSSKGMGIGAYQAREFARAAGGDAEVESEPGRGTLFRLWFPAAQAQGEAASTGLET